MRILLTGGGGLVGSYVAEHLLTRGPKVVHDDLSTGKRKKVISWDRSKSLEMRKLGYRSRGSHAEMRPYHRRRRGGA
jgi:nucleoside-diphosphate-sugar epimerase